jgi:hypothetical protein
MDELLRARRYAQLRVSPLEAVLSLLDEQQLARPPVRRQELCALELLLAQQQPDEQQPVQLAQQQVRLVLDAQRVAPQQQVATVSISLQQPSSSRLQPQLPAPPDRENVSAPTQRENYRSSSSASSFL